MGHHPLLLSQQHTEQCRGQAKYMRPDKQTNKQTGRYLVSHSGNLVTNESANWMTDQSEHTNPNQLIRQLVSGLSCPQLSSPSPHLAASLSMFLCLPSTSAPLFFCLNLLYIRTHRWPHPEAQPHVNSPLRVCPRPATSFQGPSFQHMQRGRKLRNRLRLLAARS